MSKSKKKSSGSGEDKEPFDVDKLHQEAQIRTSLRNSNRQRDVRNHNQREFDVDVKKSYEASLERLDKKAANYDEQVEHIESVLAAGACRYDS